MLNKYPIDQTILDDIIMRQSWRKEMMPRITFLRGTVVQVYPFQICIFQVWALSKGLELKLVKLKAI